MHCNGERRGENVDSQARRGVLGETFARLRNLRLANFVRRIPVPPPTTPVQNEERRIPPPVPIRTSSLPHNNANTRIYVYTHGAQLCSRDSRPNIRFGFNHFKFVKVIGQGGFGVVCEVKRHNTGEPWAVKIGRVEDMKTEFKIYDALRGLKSIPSSPIYFEEKGCALISMELLGLNMSDWRELKQQLTIKEVFDAARQMIELVRIVHAHRIIHCDIKVSNFAFGKGVKQDKLFIIDFGLAQAFKNPDGSRIEKCEPYPMKGTIAFCSARIHDEAHPAPRDDLESVAFSCLELLEGKLPWDDLDYDNPDHSEFYRLKKGGTDGRGLFAIPEFEELLRKIRKLEFSDEPDYKAMIELLTVPESRLRELSRKFTIPRSEYRRSAIPKELSGVTKQTLLRFRV
ncbi:unnamed protein product [Caenorhabditis sp. 36 PRJEB53466]|nr:unnamed protein product [Caenorhabditis sp. 36 PRJEB53466]